MPRRPRAGRQTSLNQVLKVQGGWSRSARSPKRHGRPLQEDEGQRQPGASESRALTVRYVRLSASTSFAWFWCGCCASLKASLIESSLFSAPMMPGLRGNEPRLRPAAADPPEHGRNNQRFLRLGSAGSREPRAWLPPEHLNNSRGRRKYRETAARGLGGQSGKRWTHPPQALRFGRMRLGPSQPFSGWEVAFQRGGDSLLARKWYPLRGCAEWRCDCRDRVGGARPHLIVRQGARRGRKKILHG